jgi:ketosteroid isomerase-like protein
MSQENVEIVRELYALLGRGGWEAVVPHLPPDFELETDPRHPKAGVYSGVAFGQFLQDLEEPFEEVSTVVERMIDIGDQVLALLKVRRRPRGSSAEMEIQVATVWTLENGRPIRARFFANRDEAIEAVGLPEQDAHAGS